MNSWPSQQADNPWTQWISSHTTQQLRVNEPYVQEQSYQSYQSYQSPQSPQSHQSQHPQQSQQSQQRHTRQRRHGHQQMANATRGSAPPQGQQHHRAPALVPGSATALQETQDLLASLGIQPNSTTAAHVSSTHAASNEGAGNSRPLSSSEIEKQLRATIVALKERMQAQYELNSTLGDRISRQDERISEQEGTISRLRQDNTELEEDIAELEEELEDESRFNIEAERSFESRLAIATSDANNQRQSAHDRDTQAFEKAISDLQSSLSIARGLANAQGRLALHHSSAHEADTLKWNSESSDLRTENSRLKEELQKMREAASKASEDPQPEDRNSNAAVESPPARAHPHEDWQARQAEFDAEPEFTFRRPLRSSGHLQATGAEHAGRRSRKALAAISRQATRSYNDRRRNGT